LYELSTGIDNMLKQGKTPAAPQFDQLRDALQQLMAEIDKLKTNPPATLTATKQLSPDEILAKLAALAMLLENDLGAADALLGELRAAIVEPEAAAGIREIAASIDVFDIDTAQAGIKRLREHLSRKA